ncbi:Golgi membrane exchange factor (Ric1p-Rgp1p) subunit [Coemansia sp. RSA 1358]|nr:Golgi membrane exchange factor (Ric1p-Rgp1p) subunit [Coemansia sp. RSA 1358]
MVEEDIGIERLAIGFAEASGSLTLATPYIKPEQMELLLIHKGTDFTSGSGISSPPIGGGLGSWVPAGSSNQIAGRSHKTLPLLISSPTVLFSELALAPGESQTFSLRVLLPKSLPPSFRGRTASISYDLVVVAKRNMLDSSAYVVRIPFRVLAHVNSLGALETFKFAQPIRMLPDHMKLTYQESTSISTPRNASPSLSSEGDELPRPASGNSETLNMEEFLPSLSSLGKTKENTDDVCEQLAKSPFLQSLLASIDSEMDSDAQIVPSMELDSHSTTSQSTSQTKSNTINDNDSKHNIQAICRKRAPVSFSLSQGNHTVASVWLPKRVYQLGDMVTGKLELHLGLVSVYQVSIWLESVETVSENFANYNPGRTEELTRRIYAEHHEFCRGTRTLGFSLTSLPVAAASFSSSLMSNIWQLRIELIIGVSSGSSACDFALSAATPFPPAKSHHSSIGGSESRSAALTVSSQITSSTIPNHNAATGQPRLLKADIPLIASKHAGFDTNKNRGGRIRSSTIIGSSGLPQSIHQHYHHGHNNHNQQHSLHQTPDGKLKEVQPQPRVSTEDIPRTVRRRYDVISSMPTQTLSCTVSIQMHPPPSKTSPPGHKDTYTSDLIMQR